jgi:glycosyltransferase involved in cell wall biosynthesis
MDNALVISTVAGEPSYAGGSLGVYGNLKCLSSSGYNVINVVIAKHNSRSSSYFNHIFIDQELGIETVTRELKKYLDEIRPSVIWLHHYWTWPYVKAFAPHYPLVLLAGDPDWEIVKLRHKNARKADNPVRRMYQHVTNLRAVRKARLNEKQIFNSINNTRGVIATWCPGIVEELSRETAVKVSPCPLGFVDFGLRQSNRKKFLLMLGNLDGANTRSGVIYFLTKFWPTWSGEPLSSKYQIRMVGSGKLSAHLKLPDNNPQFEWVGYVEDLSTEWENALALFVPVPERMGFRTRVVESWIRGVPVVAHQRNEESVPEMKDGINYIAVDDAASMKRAIQKLEDPDYYSRLIDAGRQTYLKYYSINAVSGIYSTLSRQAINLKRVS